MNQICPSCGEEKLPENPLCFYCYHRGKTGATKMITLMILEKHPLITNDEVVFRMNSSLYKKTKLSTMIPILTRYMNLGLVTARKKPKRAGDPKFGRRKLLYSTTRKGRKRLAIYLEKWNRGMLIGINSGEGKSKIRMTLDYKRRASSIRKRIKTNTYQRFTFLMSHRKNIEP